MAATQRCDLVIGIVAAAALVAYRAVNLAGNYAGAAAYAIGFTQSDGAIGDRVPVGASDIVIATAASAIAIGDLVEVVGAVGKLQTKAAGISVGRAMTAAAADGDLIEVRLIPN